MQNIPVQECENDLCVCVLHPVKQSEATDNQEEQDGRRGGDLYFWRRYSHGVPGERATVGSPLLRWQCWRNLQKMSVRQESKQKGFILWSLETGKQHNAQTKRCNNWFWECAELQSHSILPFGLKTEWPPLIHWTPTVEHRGTKKEREKKRSRPISRTSRPFLLLWQQQGQEEATLDAGQLCVDTILAFSRRLSALQHTNTDSHVAAIPSVANWSEIYVVKLFWLRIIISLLETANWGCNHSNQNSC